MDNGDDLIKPCNCPKYAHPKCIARWQISKIGTSEEHCCRFCNGKMPCWKETFGIQSNRKDAVCFRIYHNGHNFKLYATPGRFDDFKRQLQVLLNLDEGQEYNIIYTCSVPDEVVSDVNINSTDDRQEDFDSAVALASMNTQVCNKNDHVMNEYDMLAMNDNSNSESNSDSNTNSDTDYIPELSFMKKIKNVFNKIYHLHKQILL
jgi:hypothetical protein